MEDSDGKHKHDEAVLRRRVRLMLFIYTEESCYKCLSSNVCFLSMYYHTIIQEIHNYFINTMYFLRKQVKGQSHLDVMVIRSKERSNHVLLF